MHYFRSINFKTYGLLMYKFTLIWAAHRHCIGTFTIHLRTLKKPDWINIMFVNKPWHNCTIGSKMWGLSETGTAAFFSKGVTAYYVNLCNNVTFKYCN